MDRELLRSLIESDIDGLLLAARKTAAPNADERLVSSFLEVQEFVRKTGREPRRDPANISETRLAMRLQALREDDVSRAALLERDELKLLKEPNPPSSIDEAIATDVAGLLDDDVPDLFDARTSKPQTMPDRIARRRPCPDFEAFRPRFESCQADLRAGRRALLPFKNPSEIEVGRFFVQSGVLVLVADVGERTADDIGKSNARTRCIFENGTESDLLLQSLASNLYKGGRRVTEPDVETLERMGLAPETKMATVYVLRSRSEDPQLTRFAHVYKIGSTRQTTAQRTANAAGEATFLGAGVETVAEYAVPVGVEKRVEHLLHGLLSPARLDAWFDRGAEIVDVTEWFAVPLRVIEEAVALIENDAAADYVYHPETETFVLRAD
jgi:hypothetical protein